MNEPILPTRLEQLLDEALLLDPAGRGAFIDSIEEALRPRLLELLRAAEGTDHAGASRQALKDLLSEHASAVRADQQLGAYKLKRLLGEGGMASVWLAEHQDRQFEQQVAIKCLKTGLATEELRSRFVQEQRILAKLQHPYISRIYDAGTSTDGVSFMVMECVKDGISLLQHCDLNQLNLERRIELFLKICMAVSYAHQNLIVHRDLKPGNILVDAAGDPKLLDFGIAKLLYGSEGARTKTGLRMLTPEYAAPEQFHGGNITTATDVYALGMILYELLSGLRPQPFNLKQSALSAGTVKPSEALRRLIRSKHNQTQMERVEQIEASRSTSIERLWHALKGDLDIIVMKALQEEPERRYQSVVALNDDLQRYLQRQPITARKDTWAYRTQKFASRHMYGLIIATVMIGLLVFATAFSLTQSARAEAESQRARSEAKRAQNQAQLAQAESQRAGALKEFLTELFNASDLGIPKDQLPTTEKLLTEGTSRVQQGFDDTPELKVDLMLTLGQIHLNLGRYEQADALFKSAVDLVDRIANPGQELWLQAHAHYIHSRLLQTDMANSNEYLIKELQSVIAQHKRAKVKPGPALGQALIWLGNEYRYGWDGKKALMHIREGMDLLKRKYSPSHPRLIAAQGVLIAALSMSDQLDEADRLIREQLRVIQVQYGTQNAKYAKSLGWLSTNAVRQARYEEAEQAARKQIAIYQRIYPESNIAWVNAFYNLSYALNWQGENQEALTAIDQAIRHEKKLSGGKSGFLAELLMFKGNAKARLGELLQAERILGEALAIAQDYFGAISPYPGNILIQLGDVQKKRGNNAVAEKSLRRAVEILEQCPPNNTTVQQIIVAMHLLAELAVKAGRPRDALPLIDKAIQRSAEVSSGDSYFRIFAQIGKAEILNDLGQHDLAERIALEVLADQALAKPAPTTFDSENRIRAEAALGDARMGLHQTKAAIEAWRNALDIFRKTPQAAFDGASVERKIKQARAQRGS